MTKKFAIVLFVIVALIIIFKDTFLKSQNVVTNKKLAHQVEENKRIPLKQVSYKVNKKNINKESDKKLTFPQSCEDSFQNLVSLKSDEYIEIFKDRDYFDSFFSDQCKSELINNEVFQKISKDFNCELLNSNFNFENMETNSHCAGLLFVLKAYSVVDYMDVSNYKDMSSAELAAHFVKMFFEIDSLTKDNLEKNAQFLDEFYARHSDDPNVVEAYIGYFSIADTVTKSSFGSEKISLIWDEVKGESFKVDRLSVLKDVVKGDISLAKKTLDDLKSVYKDEPELDYYTAAYYWKKDNRDMANSYLDKAIEKSKPGCSYCTPDLYKSTKDRLQNAKYGDDKLFSVSIGLNFENL